MGITHITASNFKSFKNIDVELNKFNILIGPNASGKSNFLQIFRFIKDLGTRGLDDAISIQGGLEYFRNINIASSSNSVIEVVYDSRYRRGLKKGNKLLGIKVDKIKYRIELIHKDSKSVMDTDERLTFYATVYELEKVEKHEKKTKTGKARKIVNYKERQEIDKGEFIVSITKRGKKEQLSMNEKFQNKTIRTKDIFKIGAELDSLVSSGIVDPEQDVNLLMMGALALAPFGNWFFGISTYDFDPKLAKKAIPITGSSRLEEDGNNLSLVLKNILENKEKRTLFTNLIKDLLPFVNDIATEKLADKCLLFRIEETFNKDEFLPSSLLSDGTISLASLILALYFDGKPLAVIEEPERNIHPYLISKIVNLMSDASKKKQIIISTHNPEMIKHSDLKNILLIQRGDDGFSFIKKPSESAELKTFLENQIGIEELFSQNLLGV